MSFGMTMWISGSCCVAPISAALFLLIAYKIKKGDLKGNERKGVLGALVVVGVILSSSMFTLLWVESLEAEYYNVTIVIADDGNDTGSIQVYLPVPIDYPNDYSMFWAEGVGGYDFKGKIDRFPFLNTSIERTSKGKMLSVTTNTSVLLTSRRWIPGTATIRSEARFDDQEDDRAFAYLSNTSESVSIAVYHERIIEDLILNWDSEYSAIGRSPPAMDESYHDGTLEKLDDDRESTEPIQLANGWQELTVFRGSFDRTT